jgi:hypothetical protein
MKKEYLDSATKKLQQETAVITANPEFQADVAELRLKWDIPKGGFTSSDETQNWNGWLYEQDEQWRLKEWPKYRKQLLKLKEAGQLKEYEDENARVNKLMPLNAFSQNIGGLLKKYRLRPGLKDGIRGYLLVNHLGHNLGVAIRTQEDPLTGFTELQLIIDENTTLNDIKAMWSAVNFHQGQLQYKKRQLRKRPQAERDKRAYELTKLEGKSAKDAADELGDEMGEVFTDSEIHDFVRRYKEKTGIK